MRGTTLSKIPATVGDPPADWCEWPDDLENDTASKGPFIELLIRVRAQLCADKQWALADEIRERLAELGIILEDSQPGATWRRA